MQAEQRQMAGEAVMAGLAGLAGRYAAALFDLAREEGWIEEAGSGLEALAAILEASSELRHMLKSPLFSPDEKKRALNKLMEQAGIGEQAGTSEKSGAGEMVRRFVNIVAANNRLPALPAMISAYHELLASHRGEAEAMVISARQLSSQHRSRIRESLGKAMGRKVRIREEIDPELLGGVVIRVESQMIDNSLRTWLNKLHARMKEAG